MPYKLASLLLSSEQKSSSIAKIAWAEADHGDPANEARFSRVGKIFSLVEVYATNAKALLLLDFFSERPKLNYYQQPDLDKNDRPSPDDLEKFFTAAIQQTNNELTAFLAEHKIDYSEPEVNATIGLLTERGLFLASLGHNQAWTLLPDQPIGKQIAKMIVPSDDNQEHAGRLFQEIFSGSLPNNGYCLISNEALAEYLEPSTALNLLVGKSPVVGAEKLRHFLQQTNRRVDFLGLIIKRCHWADQDKEGCADLPIGQISGSQSTVVQTQLTGNNLRITEERTEKILNPSGWIKFRQLIKKAINYSWQTIQKLTRRDWRTIWQEYRQDGQNSYLEIKDKVGGWRGWPILAKYGRQAILISRTSWYKAQPRLQVASRRLMVFWFKTAPWRCRLIERYWLPIDRLFQPIVRRCQLAKAWLVSCLNNGCRRPRNFWQKLSKRSRLFLGLTGACLVLLLVGLLWQHYGQIKQANFQQQIDQVAIVEQKHNQIEANLLYNNLTSANQSLDEASALIDRWQNTKEKTPEVITARWQKVLSKQENLLGQVRHIYTLRNDQVLGGQLVSSVSSTASFIKANGQLLAWTDNQSRQVYYQNSRQEWQAIAWPNGWQAIVATAADGQSWYFVAADGQIASLDRNGQWKIWPLDKPITQIKALAFYGGRLYVVTGDNQIYRYQKQVDQFTGGQQWNTDRLPAGEIAGIAVDGQVYVFYQDNRAFRLNNGHSQAITIQAMDPKSDGWLICQFLPDDKDFYCLESGGRRILRYHQDGAISSQYRLADSSTQAVAINPIGQAIYWLSASGLQKFPLPAEINKE